MDSTDNQIVRLVVALLAVAGCVIWSHIWLHALETRRGRLGIMLRALAFVFLSYILNVGAMSVLILIPGVIEGSRIMLIWRNITRIHSVLAHVIVGLSIVWSEMGKADE